MDVRYIKFRFIISTPYLGVGVRERPGEAPAYHFQAGKTG